MNLSRVQGEVIHDVSGSGSRRASETVSQPSERLMDRVRPLRATHRSCPQPSQAWAKSNVVRTSWLT